MANGYCAECGGNINLGKKPRKGQHASCRRCGASMVVANLSPIELEMTFGDDTGDWDNYDFYSESDHRRIKY
jgi:hypothetical protein